MKILVVCRSRDGIISPFIREQVDSVRELGMEVDYHLIEGRSVLAYLKNIIPLKRTINRLKPDLIHAHYSMSGLLSCSQFKVPVVVTFHGSDIQNQSISLIARLTEMLAKACISVSDRGLNPKNSKKSYIIPCGVDLKTFYPCDRAEARRAMDLRQDKKYILFSSSFGNRIKNYSLAEHALGILADNTIETIELSGYNRKQVALLLNAADLALMTSIREGSPQFIKEAMACNTPVVTTDVGDVKELLSGVDGCFLTTYDPLDVAEKISQAVQFGRKTKGRQRVASLSLDKIAEKLANLYTILSKD